MKNKKAARITVEIILWAMTLVVLVPLAFVLINSLKTTAEAARLNMDLPDKLMYENYETVFNKGHIVRSFLNSLLHSGVSSLLSNLTAAMAAFAMAQQIEVFQRGAYLFSPGACRND